MDSYNSYSIVINLKAHKGGRFEEKEEDVFLASSLFASL